MIRVIEHGKLELAGIVLKSGSDQQTSIRLNSTPSAQNVPTTRMIAVATRLARRAASSLLLFARYSVKIGTNADDSAPSANRSLVRLGIRNASAKGIENLSRRRRAPPSPAHEPAR